MKYSLYRDHNIDWQEYTRHHLPYPETTDPVLARTYVPMNYSIDSTGKIIDIEPIQEPSRWTDRQYNSNPDFQQAAFQFLQSADQHIDLKKYTSLYEGPKRMDIQFIYSKSYFEEEGSNIVLNPDQPAEYIDGMEIFYHKIAPPNGCDGIASVVFLIDTSGKICKPEAFAIMGKTNAQVAFYHLSLLGSWHPALHQGKPVVSQMNCRLSL